jgi:hypothetical protein
MLPSHQQNAGKNRDIRIASRYFENVSQFIYFEMAVTYHILIPGDVKRRLNSGNACYHSVQNFLLSHLLSKTVKNRTPNTIILLVALHRC